MTAPAIFRIGRYARAVDPRIAAVVVQLDMHLGEPDVVEFFPTVVALLDAEGKPLHLAGTYDRLACLAWDVVESRVTDPDGTYRVEITPAVGVYPIESNESVR